MAGALAGLKDLHDGGADPEAVLVELAEFVHLVTRLKLAPKAVEDAAITPDERSRGTTLAATLGMPVLTRAWQMLSKGLLEVKDSARPLAAADMVLVRLAYAADLPTPDEALRKLATLTNEFTTPVEGGRTAAPAPSSATPTSAGGGRGGDHARERARDVAGAPVRTSGAALKLERTIEPSPRLDRFEDVVALAGRHRDIQLKLALERDVRLVRFEDGAIEFSTAPGASPHLAQTLMRRLQDWTGRRWIVAVRREPGAPSLREAAEEQARQAMNGVRADPLVRRAFEVFPGAEIVAVRVTEEASGAASGAGDDEIGFIDDPGAEADP
jgi:DNA polymerase-3 subunit gamma/tau